MGRMVQMMYVEPRTPRRQLEGVVVRCDGLKVRVEGASNIRSNFGGSTGHTAGAQTGREVDTSGTEAGI